MSTMVPPASRGRRRFLSATTSVVGAAGAVAAAWPFISYWQPSEGARAAGAPIAIDVSKVEPGQQVTAPWQRKPVWILHRTPEMLERLSEIAGSLRDPRSEVRTQQPDYARNLYRSIRPEYLVVIGLCTHLGCVPTFRPELAPADLGPAWPGGYFCPCHGSKFDLAGRVYKSVPAPTNLVVPPHRYLDERTVEIGTDTSPA